MSSSESTGSRRAPRARHDALRRCVLSLLVILTAASKAGAQTGYFNTDAGRPLTVEDAYAIERSSVELQPLGLTAARHTRAVYALQLEPELAFGILPRTQLDVSLAWRRAERGTVYQSGLAGMTLGLLHNLNVETLRLPALGVAAEVQAPVGALSPTEASVTFKGIATRTFVPVRLHLNASYAVGRSPTTLTLLHGVIPEVPRWLVGLSADKALVFRALLLSAEVVVKRPTVPLHQTVWESAAGLRYQLDPRLVLDAGLSRHLTGDDRAWSLTAGVAWSGGSWPF